MKYKHPYQLYLNFRLTIKKNRKLKIACNIILLFFSLTVFAPLLSNDKPLVCSYNKTILFPAFSLKNEIKIGDTILNYNMGKDWKLLETDFSIFTPCSYSPNTIDADNAPRISPFDKQTLTLKNNKIINLPFKFRHWFGTTQNGNDVLSGIIYGTRITFLVSFLSMLIASLIGITLGAIAGYFNTSDLKISYPQLVSLCIGVFFGWFYATIITNYLFINPFKNGGINLIVYLILFTTTAFLVLILFNLIGKKITIILNLKSKLNFPISIIILKIMETISAVPVVLLIIALSAVAKPSYTLLILIIGFLSWIPIARLTRAEFLKAKHLDYVTACNAYGMSKFKIMYTQILPNVLPIIGIQILFGITSTVLIESSLSFLGVGVPTNTVTWGSLLNDARNYYTAWWLIVFPGFCLLLLTLSLNTIENYLSSEK